jgi:hypothetical protein
VLEEMGARLAFDMFGDGNGIRGRRSSISGNEVTLTDARTADRFKRGMVLGASGNSDGIVAAHRHDVRDADQPRREQDHAQRCVRDRGLR